MPKKGFNTYFDTLLKILIHNKKAPADARAFE